MGNLLISESGRTRERPGSKSKSRRRERKPTLARYQRRPAHRFLKVPNRVTWAEGLAFYLKRQPMVPQPSNQSRLRPSQVSSLRRSLSVEKGCKIVKVRRYKHTSHHSACEKDVPHYYCGCTRSRSG